MTESEEIIFVQNLLKEKLSDNPSKLDEQLRLIESWNSRILTMYADAASNLALKTQAVLRDPAFEDNNPSGLQQRVALKAAVASEQRMFDILKGLAGAIKGKSILGMALRKRSIAETSTHST